MATDWAVQVRKYAADAEDAVIAGIVRYCGVALASRDSALVAFSDKDELARVREGFLKKKLGLKAADAELDAAIAKVGELMKGNRARQRVTVYYLLASHFDKLALFAPKASPKAPAAKKQAATNAKPAKLRATDKKASAKTKAPVKLKPPVEAEPAPAVAAPLAMAAPVAPPPAPPPAAPEPLAGPAEASAVRSPMRVGGLWWILTIVILAMLAWWLFLR